MIHPTVRRGPIHHDISLPKIACRTLCVPVQGAPEPRPVSKRSHTGSLGALFTRVRGTEILRSSYPASRIPVTVRDPRVEERPLRGAYKARSKLLRA